jgi:hypothetical protein
LRQWRFAKIKRFYFLRIFLFLIFFFLTIYLYSFEIIITFYPDKVISFLDTALDEKGIGLTFLFAYLPFSHYFFSLKEAHVGLFVDYKKRVYKRMVALLRYLGYTRPLYEFTDKREVARDLKPFLTDLSLFEKSRLYVLHKIGSFRTKNLLLNYRKPFFDASYPSKNEPAYFRKRNWSIFLKPHQKPYKKKHYMHFLSNKGRNYDFDIYEDRIPFFVNEGDEFKTQLAYLHPYINKPASVNIDYYFEPQLLWHWEKQNNRQYRTRHYRRRSKFFPGATQYFLNIYHDRVYLFQLHPSKRFDYMHRDEYLYLMRVLRKKLRSVGKPYKHPGLYYPTSNLEKLYLGLKKKKRLGAYVPFFPVRTRSIFELIEKEAFTNPSAFEDDNFYANLFTNGYYDELVNFLNWNWGGEDMALFKYFFYRRYFHVVDPSYYFHPHNIFNKHVYDRNFIYRSEAFWLLYSLYYTDRAFALGANATFDFTNMNMGPAWKPTNLEENVQLNDFFLDYVDWDFFSVRNILTSWSYFESPWGHPKWRVKQGVFMQGDLPLLSRHGYGSSHHFAFFKNFFFKYKYKIASAFYRKHVANKDEFYVLYFPFSKDDFKTSFSLFFRFIFDFFVRKCFEIFISFVFMCLLFLRDVFNPFAFFFLAHVKSDKPLLRTAEWLFQEIFAYMQSPFWYALNEWVRYFLVFGKSFFLFSYYIPFVFLFIKWLYFMAFAYIILVYFEKLHDDVPEELRGPILGFFSIFIIIIMFLYILLLGDFQAMDF